MTAKRGKSKQSLRITKTVGLKERREKSYGWLAERSNATVLKTADGATRPGVRIPHHPPQKQNAPLGILFLSRMVRDKRTHGLGFDKQ